MALKLVKPQSEAEKQTKTTTDTWEVTPNEAKSWKLPPFQRPLKVNEKLMAISKEIAETTIIPGVITIGWLNGERYLIDGQHRREAFLLSETPLGYVDVRIAHYKTMAEMAEEFYKLNSRISVMKPDDYLRALESSEPLLAKIRRRCPFIGYGQIRRGENSPILSMSAALRMWWASSKDTPTNAGVTGVDGIRQLSDEDAGHMMDFLEMALAAWGKDPEYQRLWTGLNLTICMWLYRRVVLSQQSVRGTKLTADQFKKCLMTMSANADYLEWLRNRNLSEQNRSPAYRRIKQMFAKWIDEETGVKAHLPAPDWAAN